MRERLEQIGMSEGLRGERLDLFIDYIIARDFTGSEGYIYEWAERFSRGLEREYSDSKGIIILDELKKGGK